MHKINGWYILYSLVKREEKELDKVTYHLLAPPTDFQQRNETPDKDDNTIEILFHYKVCKYCTLSVYWTIRRRQM